MRAALLLLLLVSLAGAEPAGGELARINDALEAWLQRHDADRPFLVADLQHGEVRYLHGAARLRLCPIITSRGTGDAPVAQRLQARVRRYGAEPFQPRDAGPFDWEQYLADEADDDGALQFDGGLLLYGHDDWHGVDGEPPAPALRLAAQDLRALVDAVAADVDLVLLPDGWDDEDLREPRR
jgi:hypothetical protein